MTVYVVDNNFDASIFDGASVAFGVFDGYHLGHQYLIGQTIASAAAEDMTSIVLTFDRDPDEVFRPEAAQKLMSNEARLAALADSGVDDVVVLPFTEDLHTLAPEEFLARTFADHAPAHLHVGSNFRFGAHASGDVDTLRTWGETTGTRIHAHDLLAAEDEAVTATRIRTLLEKGDVQGAAVLLGHPFMLCGVVEKGRGEGKGFGFATANLHVPDNELVLADGVYAGYAWVEDEDAVGEGSDEADGGTGGGTSVVNDETDGESNAQLSPFGKPVYKAALSVGVSPTFKAIGATANMEVHLLDFEGDLVGRTICIEFALRLEPLHKYGTIDELVERVTADINWIRDNL